MENRYLFKAKRQDNGKWVTGYYAVIGNKNVIIEKSAKDYFCIDNGENRHGNQIYEVNSKTICQCTGLKDKNGELIWENDIMCLTYGSHRKYGYVRYGEYNCSCCEGVYGWYFENEDIRHNDWYEVVGNTFDNPELIEGKTNDD